MSYLSKLVDSAKSVLQQTTGGSEASASKSLAESSKRLPSITPSSNGVTPLADLPLEKPLRSMVDATKQLIERTVPEPYLYKDFGKDAIPTPADGYRFPSPGSQPEPHFLRGKEARLAKNYLFQRGYYLADDAGTELHKQTGDEPWRNVRNWGPLNINPSEYHFAITGKKDNKDETIHIPK